MAKAKQGNPITIKRYRVPIDPPIDIFLVEYQLSGAGVWREVCPTEQALKWFLRGIQASGPGFTVNPEIPTQAELLPSVGV